MTTPDKIAIIDIGSNSVRLVVYQRVATEWWPLVNEKATCRLGEDLATTASLSSAGWAKAEQALERFAWVIRAHGVRVVHVLGTAALRQASDSAAFCTMVAESFGWTVQVLTGEQEAFYAAHSIIAYLPDVSGYAADLGGSSCELAALLPEPAARAVSIAVGIFDNNRQDALIALRRAVTEFAARGYSGDERLFAIGGTWRALAHLYTQEAGYPLEDSHNLTLSMTVILPFLDKVSKLDAKTLKNVPHISKARAMYLPFAAAVLKELVQGLGAQRVSFWNKGIREGYLYRHYGVAEPATTTAQRLTEEAAAYAGIVGDNGALLAWLAPLHPYMSDGISALWPAAAALSDIAQFEHDDHREYVAFTKILYAPLLSASHAERFFLAMVLFARYAGSLEDDWLKPYLPHMPASWRLPALLLGQALRLAKVISAGQPEVLAGTPLAITDGAVWLKSSPFSPPLLEELMDKRLKNIQKTLDALRP